MISEKDIKLGGLVMEHPRGKAFDEEVIALLRVWIRRFCTRADRRVRFPDTTYRWKHLAEREGANYPHDVPKNAVETVGQGIGLYVAEGEFMVAALREGYLLKTDSKDKNTCTVNMRLLTKNEQLQRHNPSTPPRAKR